LGKNGGTIKFIHPAPAKAFHQYFDHWENALPGIKCFVYQHPRELVFLRIKLVGLNAATSKQVLEDMVDTLGAKVITSAGVKGKANSLLDLKYSDAITLGNVVLFLYGDEENPDRSPSEVIGTDSAKADASFFDYHQVQDGKFSRSLSKEVVTLGQLDQVNQWNLDGRKVLHGFWWTATPTTKQFIGGKGNVNKNTRALWRDSITKNQKVITPFRQLIAKQTVQKEGRDRCLGNVFVVDFVGDLVRFNWDAVMEFVFKTNKQGLCVRQQQDELNNEDTPVINYKGE